MVDAATSFRARHADAASPSRPTIAACRLSSRSAGATAEALAAYARALRRRALSRRRKAPTGSGNGSATRGRTAWSRPSGRGGRPVYALALEVVRTGPFRIARFMGGRHANGNFPAADAGLRCLGRRSRHAGDRGGDPPGAARHRHTGAGAPAARSRRDAQSAAGAAASTPAPICRSPSICDGGFDALLGRASGKRKRKKHRSQTRKFEAAGGFRRIEARTPERDGALLDAFFAMKECRFRKMGIANVFGDAEVQALLPRALCRARSERSRRPSCCTGWRSTASCAPSPARAAAASG